MQCSCDDDDALCSPTCRCTVTASGVSAAAAVMVVVVVWCWRDIGWTSSIASRKMPLFCTVCCPLASLTTSSVRHAQQAAFRDISLPLPVCIYDISHQPSHRSTHCHCPSASMTYHINQATDQLTSTARLHLWHITSTQPQINTPNTPRS